MLKFARYFLLIALFGTAFSLKATHVRAGEITYKWISGYTYSITLTTYTDDGPAVADRCKMTIYFGDGGSCTATRENGPNAPSTSECPVSKAGVIIQPGFKQNIYSCVHTYPGPTSYKIFVQDANRNSGIINIPNSVNQPFYIESLLVIGSKPNNSNQLTIMPLYEAALYTCFYHNPGAFDPDGDSLSYEITTCKIPSGTVVVTGVTVPGYTYPDPGPAGSFSINPLTGTLSWCKPQQAGEYNIAIKIKEWRKSSCNGSYSMVGYVIRDMQIVVQTSSNLGAPVFSLTKDTCVAAETNLSVNISASDPNGVLFSGTGTPFNTATPAFFTISTSTSCVLNWPTTCSDIKAQPHNCFLKATDYGFPNLSNFINYNITVIAPAPQNLVVNPLLNIMQLTWNKPQCHPTSGNKIAGYNFYRITGSSSWAHTPCERGMPASAGFTYIGSTFAENDTTALDFTVISLPNNTTCSYAVTAFYNDCSESYASVPVSNQIVIGIDEKTKNNYSISLFPNPGYDVFNIELNTEKQNNFLIELFDVNGRKLKSFGSTFVETKTNIELDLKEIESGYYFLKIENDQKKYSYKPLIKL